MYDKHLSGHTSLVLRPIKALLLLLFPAFEELHDNIKFVIIGRKLFKENDQRGEREQTIVIAILVVIVIIAAVIDYRYGVGFNARNG